MSGSTIERAVAAGGNADRAGFAAAIGAAWRQSVDAILRAGRTLIEAKAALGHGEFGAMIAEDLPFSHSTANKLMALAEAGWLANSESIPNLPNGWAALYELNLLDAETRAAALGDGRINPDMTLNDAKGLRRGVNRRVKLDLAEARASRGVPLGEASQLDQPPASDGAAPAPARRYAVVYADPPWTQETRSEKGKTKSADNHYPVMSLDALCALPVPAIAADDAMLALWTFGTHLDQALALIDAWGFRYVTKCTWLKTTESGAPHVGTGFWFRDTDEDLLLARRGAGLPAPMPGTQYNSAIPAPHTGRHSGKPELFRGMLDAYFPGVRKIELFAREAADAPGWDAWGNEVGFVRGDAGAGS